MEGKRNRGEVTAELSEKVWARLCRENALVASEVWVDDARRVDFVAYRPHRPRDRSSNHATAAELESGTFTFVEVKSCMDDFTSGHGRTFEGDENWLVCPLELADSLASKGMLPKGAAVYSPDARGAYEGAGELHLPYAEISVIDQAVEKVWQGEGWYRVTDGYGEEWEPDFYVTRECLVADMRDAYDQARVCVPCVEPVSDPSLRRARSL